MHTPVAIWITALKNFINTLLFTTMVCAALYSILIVLLGRFDMVEIPNISFIYTFLVFSIFAL